MLKYTCLNKLVKENRAVQDNGASKAQQALENLDARSRRIIQARWLAEKDPATLHDLADEFGVSAERIRQIENKALGKMKESMAALGAAA